MWVEIQPATGKTSVLFLSTHLQPRELGYRGKKRLKINDCASLGNKNETNNCVVSSPKLLKTIILRG